MDCVSLAELGLLLYVCRVKWAEMMQQPLFPEGPRGLMQGEKRQWLSLP